MRSTDGFPSVSRHVDWTQDMSVYELKSARCNLAIHTQSADHFMRNKPAATEIAAWLPICCIGLWRQHLSNTPAYNLKSSEDIWQPSSGAVTDCCSRFCRRSRVGYLTQGHKEMLQRIFKRANRRGFTVREYDLEALAENAQYFITAVLQTTVWTIYTRQTENQQVPCSLDTEVTISPYLYNTPRI